MAEGGSSCELSLEQRSKVLYAKVSSLYKELYSVYTDAKAAEKDIALFPSFRGKYKTLESLYNEFVNSYETLFEIYILMDKEKEYPVDDKKKSQVKSWVWECHGFYETTMNPIPKSRSTSKSNETNELEGSASTLVRARLPKIQIPTFYGDPLKWPHFKDMFVSLVHDEDALTDIEKFHHLRASLSGEPLRIASATPLAAVNYNTAWGALTKRYDNKRILATAYMQRVRQFKISNQNTIGIKHLRMFLETVAESFTALGSLAIPNEADYLKLSLALECLDSDTRRLFEEKQAGQEFPTYQSLIDFVEQRCQTLEISTLIVDRCGPPKGRNDNTSDRSKTLTTLEQTTPPGQFLPNKQNRYACYMCKGNHLLYRCFSFQRQTIPQKIEFVQNNNLCYNCLQPGHAAKKCPSTNTCTYCKRKHHSLLHQADSASEECSSAINKTMPAATSNASAEHLQDTTSSGLVGAATERKAVLLGTAIVHMRDWKGSLQPVRIVLDSGSQFSIMTTDCAKRLGLAWTPMKRTIHGVGGIQPPPAKGTVHCHIRPRDNPGKVLETHALIMPTITSNLPLLSLNPMIADHFSSINLADNCFWVSKPIDFLLGSDLFLQVLIPEPAIKISGQFGTLPTIFGHVIMGIPPDCQEDYHATSLTVTDSPISDEILKGFWEIEEALPTKYLHPEEQDCDAHFQKHLRRLPNGRYMVALPFRQTPPTFHASKQLAMRRFRNLEHKFDRDINLKQRYSEFMKEYIELDHMQVTSADSAYVIPHHAVFKTELGTAQPPKLRVVFDASMKAPITSLNDNLLIGPKLQKDITSIILNFRTHRIAFCTDIIKMYRQILVRPIDRCYQHILWRFSAEDPVQTYELNTITYGLASSPYLAIRVLQQLSQDDGNKYPLAAKILQNDVYVDDIITGADSIDEALTLKKQLAALLAGGGFDVHKWSSNSTEFLSTIPNDTRANVGPLPSDNTTKVLGLLWDAETDSLRYHVNFTPSVITKRSILSIIARLYDPLGFLAPTVFLAKSILQQLWIRRLDWDDQPPNDIVRNWEEFLEVLPKLCELRLPRWLQTADGLLSIFGFCDASEKGYAAVLYLRVVAAEAVIKTFLIKAKTRLAPVKTISIPRLELCAAQLLTKLLRSIECFSNTYRPTDIHLFTDSTIVLSWLRLTPSELHTFVANRVGYILSYTELHQWHHVPSIENPADIASRGALANSLLNNDLWWNGPRWMHNHPVTLPPTPEVLSEVPERKPISVNVLAITTDEHLHNKLLTTLSSYHRAIATMAYVLRFCYNVSHKNNKKLGALTAEEIDESTTYLIRETQHQYFESDFDFKLQKCLSPKFKELAVFLDTDGLLRVGGRLNYAQLPFEKKHPVVLPPQAPLTALLIEYIHAKYFHLGLAALQAYIQRSYYVFKLKSLVRKTIWKCLRCFKARAQTSSPFMADLPLSRVSQGRPFLRVGVDFAGPFMIKLSTRRNSAITKAYLCVFVCMAVKAVHLEVVSALTTDAFLASFDRFTARRGLPTDIYSDCGLNFIGAARRLKELYKWYFSDSTERELINHSATLGIKWHFNPPYAPHFGGLWEAAVKVAKIHLHKTLGTQTFFFEELATLFTRIEAVMNSRPLAQPDSHPDNYDYLTPGHFLIGSALIAPPEKTVLDINMNLLSRWQLIQRATQTFWKRWSNEYIHQLQVRAKWNKQTDPLHVNDLVLLQDPNSPPFQWKLGRILELHPGNDGIARVVTVKTEHGSFQRAVHRLAVLPRANQSSQ